ncbi:ribosome silencing factor [Fodinicurvata halophila]|uniref:Ribosomal silencing factor RsfS n=1 Tax=Fodinicurvata halophila TaxID=1419723 RepID=A0ABV8UIM1_9PROT
MTQNSVTEMPGGLQATPGTDSSSLIQLIQASLEDDQAVEPVIIDLSGKSSFADYMVIASGRSARQVGAIADHLHQRLKAAGVSDLALEGTNHCDWVLIDAGDVVIHLFRPEIREFYNLEKMWGGTTPEGSHDPEA